MTLRLPSLVVFLACVLDCCCGGEEKAVKSIRNPKTIVLSVFEVVWFTLLVWIVVPLAEVCTLSTRRV